MQKNEAKNKTLWEQIWGRAKYWGGNYKSENVVILGP